MAGTRLRTMRRTLITTAALLAGLTALTACGSSSNSSASAKGLPDQIKLVAINPMTGPAAFAGLAANKGYELAIKEINDSDLLGGSKLKLEEVDTKGEAQEAASKLTTAISDKSIPAVFGSVLSQDALAMSPIAQKSQMPIMYTQAGSDGVVIGDYTWRATPLMGTYYSVIKKFIADNGYKSTGIIYTSVSPTLTDVATKTIPELGMKITKTIATSATTQDFAAPVQQILATKPDVVTVLLQGAANPSTMTALRQAGYTGKVLGNSAASAGNLDPAGAAGVGMVWPVDFNYEQKAASSQKFVAAYKAAYGEDPLNYAAEAYDAAYFVARAIAAADSTDRAAVKDAMVAESKKSFDGALGEGLTWKDGTIVLDGVVVEHTADGEKLLYEGSGQ